MAVFVVSDGAQLMQDISDATDKCGEDCHCRVIMRNRLVLGLAGDKQAGKLGGAGGDAGGDKVVEEGRSAGEQAQAGDVGVEEPVVVPLAQDQGGVGVGDQASLVVLVLELADEALGERADGPHDLGHPHPLGSVDGADDVVGGEDLLVAVGLLEHPPVDPAGGLHDDIHLPPRGGEA
eukprot:77431-Hanusia_phi.AAC.8